MIGLTFDVDWAPDEIILDTLDLLAAYKVKATFFATHDSKVIRGITDPTIEIGIHPNFNQLLNRQDDRDFRQVIGDLYKVYPKAKGIRSHSLVHSSPILDYCRELGFSYDVNQFLPYMQGIEPYRLYNGLVRIPYHWEDDVHWMYNKSFADSGIDLRQTGTKVLNFHPVHVYLNTPSDEFYQTVRPFYREVNRLLELRNDRILGTRDMLIDTLKRIRKESLSTCTMEELAQSCL